MYPRLSRKRIIPNLPRNCVSDFNGAAPIASPPGIAAMLLLESLIHQLVSRSILSVGEAIEIVDVAAEVEREIAPDVTDGAAMPRPATSLAAIANSLRYDLKD